ncbi:hypothetical protein [Bacillus wiedmannii]|uniref:hypothetical protein n=1 Tax=Bacillus wiedmannii TaxID=1890302 RepID=UPI000BFD354D|nr:hypothetical protein [Bacillus wiedmannii]PHA62874.1 hypothetical protein COE75_16705 [Bacillus wiedmannii]
MKKLTDDQQSRAIKKTIDMHKEMNTDSFFMENYKPEERTVEKCAEAVLDDNMRIDYTKEDLKEVVRICYVFMDGIELCPKCKTEHKKLRALSRRDNKTMICDSCGTREAMEDMLGI